ncbi:hypothetical protein B4U79_11946 [Dinothrombium tinctorium]|uniref:CUB domain-containing protein n=1 Tax=Dinothrombium tinctorium TaxID=1965070 RepID=A0A3S3PEB0_9ACAR|nr:hypothetical protein B4U79_11946 [Dinothrombium tinctorium]
MILATIESTSEGDIGGNGVQMLLNTLFRIFTFSQILVEIQSIDKRWTKLEHSLTSTELSSTRISANISSLDLRKEKLHFSCKALLEFTCKSGQCIQSSKYCDGFSDCGDGSDEQIGCTKCNQTLYGEVGAKYFLRLTEPIQKFHPFFCEITFSAIGDFHTDFGMKLSGSDCDRVFEDCLPPRKCSITSPNYPGFYSRNITCSFLIQQMHRIPKGQKARIVVNQPNEYKITLFAGTSSSGSKAKKGLIFDCELDVISIYDGSNRNARKLLDFCGSGVLPPILSTRNEMLIVLKSSANNILFDSRFQLNIEVKLYKEELTLPTNACDYVYNGAKIRSGVINSQTVQSNVTCSYSFVSNNIWDRIWIYFVSYFVQDLKQWSREETCDSSKLVISDTMNITFCEKTSPKICGREFEDNNYLANIPCLYPQESYLSSGPRMLITQTHSMLANVYSTPSHFTAKFEFIDTQEFGEPIIGTLCDRRFMSYKYPKGIFRSTRNLFYYGRGGQKSISCSYHFVTNVQQRLRLSLKTLKLKTENCVQVRDAINNSYQCQFAAAKNVKRRSTLIILESMKSERIHVACFCNSINSSLLTFDMIGSEVILNFTVTEMSSFQDFNDFGFEASFEFLAAIDCEANTIHTRNEREAEITFTVPSNYDFSQTELKCRWIIAAFSGKHLDLKVNGSKLTKQNNCSQNNRYIIYYGNPWRPFVTLCAHLQTGKGNENFQDIHLSLPSAENKSPESNLLFSDTYSKSSSFSNESGSQLQAIIEIRAKRNGLFNFKWLQVNKEKQDTSSSKLMSKTDCIYKCPELNVCLSPDLMCDGTNHCPSGFDENKHNCSAFPTVWIVLISTFAAILLFAFCSYIFVLISRRRKRVNEADNATSSAAISEIGSRDERFLTHSSEYQATHEFNFRFKTEELGLESISNQEVAAFYCGQRYRSLGRVYQ